MGFLSSEKGGLGLPRSKFEGKKGGGRSSRDVGESGNKAFGKLSVQAVTLSLFSLSLLHEHALPGRKVAWGLKEPPQFIYLWRCRVINQLKSTRSVHGLYFFQTGQKETALVFGTPCNWFNSIHTVMSCDERLGLLALWPQVWYYVGRTSPAWHLHLRGLV